MHQDYFDLIFRDVIDAKANPLYVVRYEDLVESKFETLCGLFCFLLDLPDLKGTNAERMVKKCVEDSELQRKTQTYALKSTTGKRNQHLKKYTKETLEIVKKDNMEMLRFFGYADEPGEDTVNAFNLTKDEIKNLKRAPAGFREHNKNAIKEVIAISKDPKSVKTH